MTCEAVQALLSAHIDGELLPHEKDQLERHLSDCSKCLRECHSLSQTKRALRSMPDHEMPEEFVAELTEIAEGGYTYYTGSVVGSFLARFRQPALIGGLSIAAVIFAMLWLFNPGTDKVNMPVIAGIDINMEKSINRIKDKVDFHPIMPDYLPQGYRFKSASVFQGRDNEKIARFSFSDGQKMFYLSEGRSGFRPMDAQIITLKNGRQGHLCVENDTSILYWTSDDLDFTLMGQIPHQTLINTADSFR